MRPTAPSWSSAVIGLTLLVAGVTRAGVVLTQLDDLTVNGGFRATAGHGWVAVLQNDAFTIYTVTNDGTFLPHGAISADGLWGVNAFCGHGDYLYVAHDVFDLRCYRISDLSEHQALADQAFCPYGLLVAGGRLYSFGSPLIVYDIADDGNLLPLSSSDRYFPLSGYYCANDRYVACVSTSDSPALFDISDPQQIHEMTGYDVYTALLTTLAPVGDEIVTFGYSWQPFNSFGQRLTPGPDTTLVLLDSYEDYVAIGKTLPMGGGFLNITPGGGTESSSLTFVKLHDVGEPIGTHRHIVPNSGGGDRDGDLLFVYKDGAWETGSVRLFRMSLTTPTLTVRNYKPGTIRLSWTHERMADRYIVSTAQGQDGPWVDRYSTTRECLDLLPTTNQLHYRVRAVWDEEPLP